MCLMRNTECITECYESQRIELSIRIPRIGQVVEMVFPYSKRE